MSYQELRRPVLLLTAAMTAVVWACGDEPIGPGPGTVPTVTTSISVVDNRFQPGANAIQVGETVTWLWSGNNPHNVTFDDQSVGSSVTQTGGSFQQTFSAPGEFTYFCTIHGRGVMSGRVVVGSVGGSAVGAGYP